jgi:hypothetical protein
MSDSSEMFARYAKAERQLCDEAGNMLATIARAIETDTGIVVTELRVTFDRARDSGDAISANCTIVHADVAPPQGDHNVRRAAASAEQNADNLASNGD